MFKYYYLQLTSKHRDSHSICSLRRIRADISRVSLGLHSGFANEPRHYCLSWFCLLNCLGVLNLQEAWQAIEANTIVFLLSRMVVNANLAYAGLFRRALSVLLSFTRSPLGLLIALTFGSGILSAVFLNDTLALVFTPLTLSLAQALSLNPIPYLLAIAGATNISVCAAVAPFNFPR